MIFFDVTKTGSASHRSGLTRVSARLREELGPRAAEVSWDSRTGDIKTSDGVAPTATDWLFTSELFSEDERPGIDAFLNASRCRTAALFHDAIPLKHPHITWPQSVARHPAYMKLLARFDRIWAVSNASREELLGFWRWAGIENTPAVEVLSLGADFNATVRRTTANHKPSQRPQLLVLGIIEPRKNQALLLDVCPDLWRDGVEFQLHVVGRVNPHFGKPIIARLNKLRREFREVLHFHEAASDAELRERYECAHTTIFPTIAEGCGLPLLESLWMGVPCICSDLPVLHENADGGGCVTVPVNDRVAWKSALRRVVTDAAYHARLSSDVTTRPLPTWRDAANVLAQSLAQPFAGAAITSS